jgi:hypothetical protein
MTEEQLHAFMDWVKAEIDLKLEEESRRDSLTESITEINCRNSLFKVFGIHE